MEKSAANDSRLSYFVSRSVEHDPDVPSDDEFDLHMFDDDKDENADAAKSGEYIKFYCENCDKWEERSCFDGHDND